MTPETCPNCGADVPHRAKACPECGADEQTGWSDVAHSENLGIPDDSFDYDDFVKREFEGEKPARERRMAFWKLVAAVLAAGMLFFLFRQMF